MLLQPSSRRMYYIRTKRMRRRRTVHSPCKLTFSDSDERHQAPWWRLCDSDAVCICSYIFNYLTVWPGAKVRPGGGRKNSQKAGGYGRRGGSSAHGGGGGDMHRYRQNGKITLEDLSRWRLLYHADVGDGWTVGQEIID